MRERTHAAHRTAALTGAALVLTAGVLWSLQGIALRLMTGESEPFQILFWRFWGQFVVLLVALAIAQRARFVGPFRRAGLVGIVGGACQAVSSFFVVLAILKTTVGNVVFIMSTAPFITALLAWLILGERLSRVTLGAMALATAGVAVMMAQGLEADRLLGSLYALAVALGFSGMTVAFRWGRNVEMVPTVCWGATMGMVTALALTAGEVAIPLRDVALSFGNGMIVAVGMLLFIRGARFVAAGVLAFLGLSEIVLAPVWTWVVVGETMSRETLAGGAIMLAALAGQIVLSARQPGEKGTR